jgi:hypothetical protein
MSEIIAAVDEAAAGQLLRTAVAALGTQSTSGSTTLGPLGVTYTVTGTLSQGTVDLIPPDTVRIANLRLDWHLSMQLRLDIGDIIPDIHIPQICIPIPCVGKVCTPKIDIVWPTITVPFSFGDFVRTTVDLGLDATRQGPDWVIEVIVQGVPNLATGLPTAAMIAGIGAAVAAAVAWVPLIGPFVAIVVAGATAAIGVAALTGLLGPILSLFIAGKRFEVQRVPAHLEILPATSAIDPSAFIMLDAVDAVIQHNPPEDELVVSADISAA